MSFQDSFIVARSLGDGIGLVTITERDIKGETLLKFARKVITLNMAKKAKIIQMGNKEAVVE